MGSSKKPTALGWALNIFLIVSVLALVGVLIYGLRIAGGNRAPRSNTQNQNNPLLMRK